jgi:methyl-accepting chemotaxis protein
MKKGKISIRTNLLIGFTLILLLVGGVSLYALTQIQTVADGTSLLYEQPLAVTRAVLEARTDIMKMQITMKDVTLTTDPVQVDKIYAGVDNDEKDALQKLDLAESKLSGDENKTAIEKTKKDLADWKQIRIQVIQAMKAFRKSAAIDLTQNEGAQQLNLLDNDLNVLQEIAAKQADSVYADAQNKRAFVTTSILAALVIAFILSIGLALFIANNITRPLASLINASHQIAEGDLVHLSTALEQLAAGDLNASYSTQSENVAIRRGDEVGELADAFNQMIARLHESGQSFRSTSAKFRELIGHISDSANQLSGTSAQLASAAEEAGRATHQISSVVQEVARGINQQTESIGMTASSAEQMGRAIEGVARGAQDQASSVAKASEITSRINQAIEKVAGNARSVTERSANAADAARKGSKTVEETLAGMREIKSRVGLSAEKVQEMGKRSDQIGAIVETIEDIASQTNLLALNAAIEAARAGEHGKGFAVVADEVRKLAERASGATKEIGGLIRGIQSTVGEAVRAMDESAREVELGVLRGGEAGQALKSILTASEAVYDQAQEAAKATEQVRAASNELVLAIDSVSAVIEENTASTEEMSAGSNEVNQAIESIASVSEENSAAVEEVSASAEEMNAQVAEVAASAYSLADMARALEARVRQFKLA